MAYATVGEVVGRAAVQVGVLSMNPTQIASFDPFASADQNVVLLIDLLRTLGDELLSELKPQIEKQGSILTASSATSYDLPADFSEMVPDTGWDRSSTQRLFGPVTPQYEQFLQAWSDGVVAQIPFRIQGLTLTFPIAPADGLDVKYKYISNYWIKSAAASSPDKASPTVSTDVVMFDPRTVVAGLKLRWLEAKGFDTTVADAAYSRALDDAKSVVGGGATLSLNGGPQRERFVDAANLPVSGWGT